MKPYHFSSSAERKELAKNLTILVDSREKRNNHILDYFERQKIPFQVGKLDYGDYSFFLSIGQQNFYFHEDVVVERKANLEELSKNLAQGRETFEKEFYKAGNDSCKVYLMVEDPRGYTGIINHTYRTDFQPRAFMASLKTWEHRFGANVQFIDPQYAGYYIYSTFIYFARERLK